MRIQVGIVGLLVVLFIVLGMTRSMSEEGYLTKPPSSSDTELVFALFLVMCFPILFGIVLR